MSKMLVIGFVWEQFALIEQVRQQGDHSQHVGGF